MNATNTDLGYRVDTQRLSGGWWPGVELFTADGAARRVDEYRVDGTVARAVKVDRLRITAKDHDKKNRADAAEQIVVFRESVGDAAVTVRLLKECGYQTILVEPVADAEPKE